MQLDRTQTHTISNETPSEMKGNKKKKTKKGNGRKTQLLRKRTSLKTNYSGKMEEK